MAESTRCSNNSHGPHRAYQAGQSGLAIVTVEASNPRWTRSTRITGYTRNALATLHAQPSFIPSRPHRAHRPIPAWQAHRTLVSRGSHFADGPRRAGHRLANGSARAHRSHNPRSPRKTGKSIGSGPADRASRTYRTLRA